MTTYFPWHSLGTPGNTGYNKLSPNLTALNDELGKRFGGSWLGGYGIRESRGSSNWSPHSYGAAFDRRWEDATVRQAVINFLLENYNVLKIQAVHDYANSRIWHVNRYPGKLPVEWWRPQPKSQVTGMGTWGRHLHIETTRDGWGDGSNISSRLTFQTPPNPNVPPGVAFDPAKRQYGLYPLNKSKATIYDTSRPPSQEEYQLTLYAQGVLVNSASQNLKIDGDFGPNTTAAVAALQAFCNVPNHRPGIIEQTTWDLIDYLQSR